MKIKLTIVPLFLLLLNIQVAGKCETNSIRLIHFNFYGDPFEFSFNDSSFVDFPGELSEASLESFYRSIAEKDYTPVINSLITYKEQNHPDDWMYYQLIRKTAQQLSPKEKNYPRYTLYKWYFLSKSGYDATISIAGDKILFYVRTDEIVYNIPFHIKGDKQYVCLNYHDYGSNIDFEKNIFAESGIHLPEAQNSFSYKITRMPEFKPGEYVQKDLSFEYAGNTYHFAVKLNPEVKNIFANYPVLDYNYYFNIPLSKETYNTLIPELQKTVQGLSMKDGVGFLMRFTRYTFLFKKDSDAFGKEKRMSPEETLLYDQSDCEDRAALFFYLVREIYKLPMIVLTYPQHVTVAVAFEKPIGNTIMYNGKRYSICEPTPQKRDLPIGKMLPSLKSEPYEVAYEYLPGNTLAATLTSR